MKLITTSLFLCVLAPFMTSTAVASPVDNPGNFTWDTGGGDLSFNSSTTLTAGIPSGAALSQRVSTGRVSIT